MDFYGLNLSLVQMDLLHPTAFQWINHRYGRCIRTDTHYKEGVLDIVIHCTTLSSRKDRVVFNTSTFQVELILHKLEGVIYGYELFLCNGEKQIEGKLVVNVAAESIKLLSATPKMSFEEDCTCSQELNVVVQFLDFLPIRNDTLINGTSFTKFYRVVIGATILSIIILLCLACSYF